MRPTYPYISEKYTTSPVSLLQARDWLHMDIPDYTAEDSKITTLIGAAVGYVEEETKLSLGISTYEWNTECLPREFTDTFYVSEIVSIEKEVEDGYEEIDPSNYRLIRTGERNSIIRWKSGFSAAATGYRIRFKAGFPDGKIPERILQAVRALISEWFDDPGDFVREKRTMVDKLLAPYLNGHAG